MNRGEEKFMNNKPHFKKVNGISTLIVNNKPFLSLSGELHNSSASSKEYMESNVWENVNKTNVNTVVAPVYWELVEKEEGIYDFSSLDYLINQARENNKKLILIWFGLWKNGLSTYIPKWMKKNQTDYPFVKNEKGESLYTVTPLSSKAIEKDSLAFTELMKYLNKEDAEDQTVIMVQVENEVGILGSDFDYGNENIKLLDNEVPEEVSKYLDKTGTWEERFNEEAKEYFMAYHYAKAINYIVKNGKAHYDIPFFVNVWLEKYPSRPGDYPTGGPTAKMGPFWKAIAPDIDAIAPDIYVPNFNEVCEQYLSFQDVLLVPETRQDLETISNLLYGLIKYNINCFSPFGIEDFFKEESEKDERTLATLAIDSDAFDYTNTGELLSDAYKILSQMSDYIIEYRGTDKIHPFIKEKESDRGELVELENCEVKVNFNKFRDNEVKSSGFIIETDENEFYVVGININVELLSPYGSDKKIGLLDFEEGEFIDNKWVRNRVLNGDERYHITINNEIKVFRIEYHSY